jgi:predicted Na+-dependent transporter
MKINNNTFTSAGIFIALIGGFFIPNGTLFKPFIPWLLGILLFFSFLKIEFSMSHFIRKELLYYPAIIIIILPAVIFLLTGGLDSTIRLGLILLCITPPATSAPVVSGFINAKREFIVTNVLIYNFFAPFIYALLLPLYFMNAEVTVNPVKILVSVSLVIFSPLLLALLVRISSRLTARFEKAAPYVNPPILFLVVASGIAASSDEIKRHFSENPVGGIMLLLIVIALCVILYFIGWMLPGDRQMKKTLALSLGHKNTALAISIALTNFNPITAVPVLLYVLVQNTINGILISREGKTVESPPAEIC